MWDSAPFPLTPRPTLALLYAMHPTQSKTWCPNFTAHWMSLSCSLLTSHYANFGLKLRLYSSWADLIVLRRMFTWQMSPTHVFPNDLQLFHWGDVQRWAVHTGYCGHTCISPLTSNAALFNTPLNAACPALICTRDWTIWELPIWVPWNPSKVRWECALWDLLPETA